MNYAMSCTPIRSISSSMPALTRLPVALLRATRPRLATDKKMGSVLFTNCPTRIKCCDDSGLNRSTVIYILKFIVWLWETNSGSIAILSAYCSNCTMFTGCDAWRSWTLRNSSQAAVMHVMRDAAKKCLYRAYYQMRVRIVNTGTNVTYECNSIHGQQYSKEAHSKN
jgi:hypothetical protein